MRRRRRLRFAQIIVTHGPADKLERTGLGMFELFDKAKMLHLRIVEHFSDIVKRHRGHIVGFENF